MQSGKLALLILGGARKPAAREDYRRFDPTFVRLPAGPPSRLSAVPCERALEQLERAFFRSHASVRGGTTSGFPSTP